MIDVYIEEIDGLWFGVAYVEEKIVATVLNSTRDNAFKQLLSSLPHETKHRIVEEKSDFVEKTLRMLTALHAGDEESKNFTLAAEYVSEPGAAVLKTAAAIPLGYVASYGDIAKVAGTGPRVVGRIMSTNPLYPIVPCHRVVGADFLLVGYGGRKSSNALQAKLNRLSKEARGFTGKKIVQVNGRNLTVYPVEYVISKAREYHLDHPLQQRLPAEKGQQGSARARSRV